MRVSLVQAALVWEDPAANRAHLGRLVAPLAGATDLVVLPEAFTTGFSLRGARFAEPPAGPTSSWLGETSRHLGAPVCGSLFVRDGDRVHNRLLWVEPDGTRHRYDKRHLFRMGGEHEAYTPGTEVVIVPTRGVRVCPLVCYDLRFPVWSRRRPTLDYDVLLYVANWPAARRHAWRQLLIARAIENAACVVGVNRVGVDGQGVAHAGDSLAVDPQGTVIADLGTDEAVCTVSLDLEALSHWRERFPVHLDADPFTLAPR